MTTNNVQAMVELEKPVESLLFLVYIGIWIAIGVIGVGVLVFFGLKKE